MTEQAVFPPRAVLLTAVQKVLAQYAGTPVTVRQLYYRLVAGGIIPNNVRSYKNIISATTDWRRAGTIPIAAFQDLTRGMDHNDTGWRSDDPEGWLRAWVKEGLNRARDYKLARWFGQPERVIVAVEKQALEGPFSVVCQEKEVDLVVCKGYPSLSYLREIAVSMKQKSVSAGRTLTFLYFGDHDPSGQDIPRSVREDLAGLFDIHLVYERVALNPNQVAKMHLIPAPVKPTDSRTPGFVAEYGEDVYELDAIEPDTLQELIRDTVDAHFVDSVYEEREEIMEAGKKVIEERLKKANVKAFLKALGVDEEGE